MEEAKEVIDTTQEACNEERSSSQNLAYEQKQPEEESMPPDGPSFDGGRYLGQLVKEMRALEIIQDSNPGVLRSTYGLVVREIDSVWGLVFARAHSYGQVPIEDAQQLLDGHECVMHEKVPIPERPGSKLIGRILGPRGISVKQLETQTGCRILIRGKGSIKAIAQLQI
ncbi:unnamed protein product [Gongylonema pulchrum]|uniref:KH_dom_type_1 domain-containing protein n=1 Tax=Gongylonema pulchrum TaxID=637853 RepID=A0A183EKF8_9BILA|nr:unnamed protein product [Gongylonema pulchrum]